MTTSAAVGMTVHLGEMAHLGFVRAQFIAPVREGILVPGRTLDRDTRAGTGPAPTRPSITGAEPLRFGFVDLERLGGNRYAIITTRRCD